MEAICIVDYELKVKANKTKNIPVCFYEFYGVWFAGELQSLISDVVRERFGADIKGRMHVFIKPDLVEKDTPILPDGNHEIMVYGHACKLYKWTAQGYHRGLVVLADDEKANSIAKVYQESMTWSWILCDTDKMKQPTGFQQ